MTYQINGTDVPIPPTSGQWKSRDTIGVDGNGHAIYTGYREFELRWGLLSSPEFSTLQGFFNAIGVTGTATVALPQYGASSYTFYNYSGCVLREPEVGQYFETYVEDVKLEVMKIPLT